jgi:hypothetical protein
LEVQTNSLGAGFGSGWTTVPGSAATNAITVSLDPSVGTVFYRLVVP